MTSVRKVSTLPIPRRGYPSLSPLARPVRLRTLPLPFDDENSQAPSTEECPPEQPRRQSPLATTTALSAPSTSAASPTPSAAAAHLVAQLAREVKAIEVAGRSATVQAEQTAPVYTSGCQLLDDCLPAGGYEAGTVVEYLQSCEGSGATTLALAAAREALAITDRHCVLVDWRQEFYPPAAAAMGVDLKRLVIVRPQTLSDRLWAIDQALRSPAIIAVIAEVEQLDDRAARRLQLAAERGGGLGLLVRSLRQRQQPSWAEVQWQVRPLVGSVAVPHRQLELQLLRARGGRTGMRAQVQINATSGRIEAGSAAAALAKTLARRHVASETPRKVV